MTQVVRRDPGLGVDLSTVPTLDDLQIGHLRHFENLADQLPGDWSRMGPWDPGQELFDAYRYQFAFMAYALGLAYYHSDSRTLLITARPRGDGATDLALVVTHAPPRPCVIAVNGVTAAVDDDSTGIDVTADGDTLRLRTRLTYETTVALRWT
jgi:hypothetical protein